MWDDFANFPEFGIKTAKFGTSERYYPLRLFFQKTPLVIAVVDTVDIVIVLEPSKEPPKWVLEPTLGTG